MGAFAAKLVASGAMVMSSFLPTGKAAAQALEGALIPPTTLEQTAPTASPEQQAIDALIAQLDKNVYVGTALKTRVTDGTVSNWDVKVIDATYDTQRARDGKSDPDVIAIRSLKKAVEAKIDTQDKKLTRSEDKKDKSAAKDEIDMEIRRQDSDAALRQQRGLMELQMWIYSGGRF